MRKWLLIFCILTGAVTVALSDSPFVIVMYDAKTESSMGPFPPQRTVWANAIKAAAQNNAKAVVLKFFYDLPSSCDDTLSAAFDLVPTFLQACIDNSNQHSNTLDRKFTVSVEGKYKKIIAAENGWIPVPVLAKKAFAVGFVDIRDMHAIPIIERYRGNYVKSLYYCILKYIFPNLRLKNNTLVRGSKRIKLDGYTQMHVTYPVNDDLEYLSLCDLLDGKIERSKIGGKIMIIGWDGAASPTMEISAGKVKIHRVFIYGLLNMYDQLK